MLGKLIKYEFKATSRMFLPLYGAIIVMSFVIGMFLKLPSGKIEIAMFVSILIFSGLFMALCIITLLVIVQRFQKNLLSQEGYLMFTLPVSTHGLVLSKAIANLLWAIISVCVAFISFIVIMTFESGYMNWGELLNDLFYVLLPQLHAEHYSIIFQVLLSAFLNFSLFIMIIYFSLSIAQLPVFCKHRNLSSFITFFAVNVILSYIAMKLALLFEHSTGNIYSDMNLYLAVANIYTSCVFVAVYFATNHILNKHLNLE